nr:hypothetical protein FVER53263_13267 [Fusarium verticillioides]
MRLSNIISIGLAFITPATVLAAPANTLHRRDCPSVDTIRQWIRDNANVGENTIFYTAGAKQEQAKAFAEQKVTDGNYWGKVFDNNKYLDWIEECGEGPEQDKLFPRMGEALARESSGTAYVIMIKGNAIANFWKDNEYPYLDENGVKIIAVNAENFDDQKDYNAAEPSSPRDADSPEEAVLEAGDDDSALGVNESERLDLQNHQLLLTFGGKRYFSPNADTAKRVLDVGTGTGIWAVEFADEHPHAEVFGIDIAPIQPDFVPPNCTFEIDDAEKEWTWTKPFDYIFVRLMVGSIADWDKLIRQCYDNLEPGGWLEVIDPVFPAKSEDGTLKPDSPLHRWDELTAKGALALGRPFDEGVNHEKRLKEAGFVNVTRKAFKWPTNTWPKDPKFKEIGLWTLANIERNLETISSFLLRQGLGMSQEEILVFIAEVRAEMRNLKVHAYWEVFVVTGQKPEELVRE